METIKAWFAAAKVYAIALVIVALAIAFWWHGHREFKAGKAAGDAEVTQMKTAYVAAADKADAYSREQQRQADEAAMAEANRREMQIETQLVLLTQRADAAEQSANQFKAKVDELKKRDPAVRAWADQPIPDSVRAAGTGSPR